MIIKGTQFENPEPGNYIARCYGLVDLGTQPHAWQGKTWSQRDVRILFELPDEKMTGKYVPESKGQPFMVAWRGKQSLHKQAMLRKHLEGWRGRAFSPEEMQGFDLKTVLGKPCRLTLIKSEDGNYINIDSISPLAKLDKCPKQINEPLYFSLEPIEFDPAMFAKLGDKTKETISGSPEYQELVEGKNDKDDEVEEAAQAASEAVRSDDDDVPF